MHVPDLRHQYDVQKCNVLYTIMHVQIYAMVLQINIARVQLMWGSLLLAQVQCGEIYMYLSHVCIAECNYYNIVHGHMNHHAYMIRTHAYMIRTHAHMFQTNGHMIQTHARVKNTVTVISLMTH